MSRGPKASKPAPDWARVLKARRARLGLRQEDVSERTEDRISAGTISDLERGKVRLDNLTFNRLADLATALDWTVTELSEQTGVGFDLPGIARSPGYALVPPYQPRLIAHAGSVGAGLSPLSYAAEHMEKRLMPHHPALEGYRDEDLITLDVVGDSMVCDEVRLTIPEGSTVYLHTRLEPQPGDIVAVWLERDQCGVLKLYKPDAGHIVLKSYNEHHRPIVVSESDTAQVQGVYLAHLAGGRRAHNAKARMRR